MLENITIENRWKVGPEIGRGGQGIVFEAARIADGKKFAIKAESKNIRVPKLLKEYSVYKYLSQHFNSSDEYGIPKVFDVVCMEDWNIMVFELMGPSIQHLYNFQKKEFSMKTVFLLAQHLLISLENLHNCGVIHRDIKPENICMGRGGKVGVVHLIDFGFAIRFQDKAGNHIPQESDRPFVGTTRYASLNAHLGLRLSRRDDLESLAYTLMYLYSGRLPWQGLKASSVAESRKLVLEKKSANVQEICRDFPTVFKTFLQCIRDLSYDEDPDYDKLRNIFEVEGKSMGFEDDGYFDWFCTPSAEYSSNATEFFDKRYNEIMKWKANDSTLPHRIEPQPTSKEIKKSRVSDDQESYKKHWWTNTKSYVSSRIFSAASVSAKPEKPTENKENEFQEATSTNRRKGRVKRAVKNVFSRFGKK